MKPTDKLKQAILDAGGTEEAAKITVDAVRASYAAGAKKATAEVSNAYYALGRKHGRAEAESVTRWVGGYAGHHDVYDDE